MKVKEVKITTEVAEKVFKKHLIKEQEIKKSLLYKEKYVTKTKDNRYLAIVKHPRYLTIIFEYKEGAAKIITAYPSSEWQKKLYEKKK